MNELLSPDGPMTTLTPYLRLVGALLLAMPIAWHRETHGDTMGLRTFPIVAVGACAFVLIGNSFIGSESPDAMARILQGLMTGIGFVGGGAILKHDSTVSGTASAASIWVVGALGAAVGFGLWGFAVALSVLNLVTVVILGRLKDSKGKTDPDPND
ncbi:MgtC/SapB family protein [Lysobacter sp. A3-1-A15]|uniref:MgtC/SapB family protein n=1 Tax=Novilysobacter viscosus TaxID=3098602 RepID=UPI002ED79BD2